VFNLLGIAVIGAALQRRLGWAGWSLIYLAGGPGTIAIYIAWHPGDTGGGSSAAVAALIGALAVLLAADADLGRLEWFAQLYSVFFAVYLAALQLGGVLPSVIAGNASIMVMVAARHAVSSSALTRASLAAVMAGGVAMTAARDDHGAGILIGVTIACLILARRRILAHPLPPGAPAGNGILQARRLAGALWLVTFLLLQIITNVCLRRSGLWPILRGHQATVPLGPSGRHTTGRGQPVPPPDRGSNPEQTAAGIRAAPAPRSIVNLTVN
jgi:hypothetical protein